MEVIQNATEKHLLPLLCLDSTAANSFEHALHLVSMAQLYVRCGELQTSFYAYNENELHLHSTIRMQMSYVFSAEQNHYISAELLMQRYGSKNPRFSLQYYL